SAFDDIVNIGKVALHFAFVKKCNGPSGGDTFCEGKISHIWTAPWTIDGEETQTCYCQSIEVVVGKGDEFVGFFGCCVKACGMIGGIGFGERDFLVKTVNGRGGSESHFHVR